MFCLSPIPFQSVRSLEQLSIIQHLTGALLVLAPVGTGKTRVLAERAVAAVEAGIAPSRILCLTFTNRAAEQMRERLMAYDGDLVRTATIKTFHGLCARILRTEAKRVGLPIDFLIYDEDDCQELVAQAFGYPRSDSKDARETFAEISACKSQLTADQIRRGVASQQIFNRGKTDFALRAMRYQALLREQHALDFSDLVLQTRAALLRNPDIYTAWQQRYDFVQVDEVQDTHHSEYDVVQILAEGSQSVALIGDMDQTIYGWRGSAPQEVMARYRQDFAPVEKSLTLNYRATRLLLEAADAFANTFEERYTAIQPAEICPAGVPIRIHQAPNGYAEGAWIAQQIQLLAKGNLDFAYRRVAVLTRTNKRAGIVATALNQAQVPCITLDEYAFFRRQEIKDALAYLRILINPHDNYAVNRMLLRPANRGIGQATIEDVIESGVDCGVRLIDMIDPQTIQNGDPFGLLLQAHKAGTVVVFDVETTGLSSDDEIVELAAIRLEDGKPVARLHHYLLPSRPVGDSEAIHGHSDHFLRHNGRPPAEVLLEFFRFIHGSCLVGHNVRFDVGMVRSHAASLGLDAPSLPWFDTWNLAARFVRSDNYRLETLAKVLQLPVTPTHKAMDDVETTVALLEKLLALAEPAGPERQMLIARHRDKFNGLAHDVARWRAAASRERPAALLSRILNESGLWHYYHDAPTSPRIQNIQRLLHEIQRRDDPALHPENALRQILDFTSLASNIDLVSDDANQVIAVTIFQSKGLEFDTVFLAGVVENELPTYFSVQNQDLEEEKRLFYVALTRAKERLYISGHDLNDRGYPCRASRFTGQIPRRLCI